MLAGKDGLKSKGYFRVLELDLAGEKAGRVRKWCGGGLIFICPQSRTLQKDLYMFRSLSSLLGFRLSRSSPSTRQFLDNTS